jgi:hypothetical protein
MADNNVTAELIRTREDVADLKARLKVVEDNTSRIYDRLRHIDDQITYGRGVMGAMTMFAALIGAGFSFLAGAVRHWLLSGGSP